MTGDDIRMWGQHTGDDGNKGFGNHSISLSHLIPLYGVRSKLALWLYVFKHCGLQMVRTNQRLNTVHE